MKLIQSKILLLGLALTVLSGCSTMGIINDEPQTTNTRIMAPPLPKHSTCENGKLETIVLSADGGAKIWYYSDNSFLSINFESGINVRITRATESAFCYDYF